MNTDYRTELERRIAQFQHYLDLMQQRRRRRGVGDCFICFEDPRDAVGPTSTRLRETEALAQQSVREGGVWEDGIGSAALDESIGIDLPDDGWRGDDSQLRFIQFRFLKQSFDLDIPNTSLYRAEAEAIMRRRSGFFYAVDRLSLEHSTNREITKRFSPLRKMYGNGDAESAAQDTAFVFFEVWRFPLDSRLIVSSASFNGEYRWEYRAPIQ